MRQRRPSWILAVLGLFVICPQPGSSQPPGSGPETSSNRLERGLEALEAGDWPAATALLTALSEDYPGEAELFYYLGVAAASSGDDRTAVLAFANAAALDPRLDWVQADLGISLYRLGEFELAEEHLLEALLQGPEDADVLLHLGLIDLEGGNDDRGERLLEESVALDARLGALAFYHAANYALDRGEMGRGAGFLEQAVLAPDADGWRQASAELLSTLGESDHSPPRLRLEAAIGVENDDNLTVSLQDLSTGIGDVAATLQGEVDLDLIRTESVAVSIGYDFYQSLHQDLKSFDLQANEPHIEIRGLTTSLQPVLRYAYRRESYDGADYLAAHSVDLDLALCRWGPLCALIGATFEDLKFDPAPLRDANRYSLRVGQETFFWSGRASFALTWEPTRQNAQRQNAPRQNIDYSAQIVQSGVTIFLDSLREGLVAGVSYDFEARDYDEISSPGFRRKDDRHVIWTGVRIPLLGPTRASLDYVRIASRSNISRFNYDENIVSFRLSAWR